MKEPEDWEALIFKSYITSMYGSDDINGKAGPLVYGFFLASQAFTFFI